MGRLLFALTLLVLAQPVNGLTASAARQDAKKAAEEKTSQPPAQHTGEGRVYVKEAGFSMVPPKGWDKGASSGNTFLVYKGPLAETNPNFNIRIVDYDDTPLDKFAVAVKQAMPKQLKEWKLLDESELMIDGKKAYTMASQAKVDAKGQDVEVKNLQYFIVGTNKKLYVLTFSAVPKVFDQQRKLYEQSALTSRTD